MSRLIPWGMSLNLVRCGICHTRPWRVEAWPDVMSLCVRVTAWCHGAVRSWAVDTLVVCAGNFEAFVRALVAFPAMRLALPPVLVAIRRLRGRRLPAPRRDAVVVWLAGVA